MVKWTFGRAAAVGAAALLYVGALVGIKTIADGTAPHSLFAAAHSLGSSPSCAASKSYWKENSGSSPSGATPMKFIGSS